MSILSLSGCYCHMVMWSRSLTQPCVSDIYVFLWRAWSCSVRVVQRSVQVHTFKIIQVFARRNVSLASMEKVWAKPERATVSTKPWRACLTCLCHPPILFWLHSNWVMNWTWQRRLKESLWYTFWNKFICLCPINLILQWLRKSVLALSGFHWKDNWTRHCIPFSICIHHHFKEKTNCEK